jgi:hypothetical protein
MRTNPLFTKLIRLHFPPVWEKYSPFAKVSVLNRFAIFDKEEVGTSKCEWMQCSSKFIARKMQKCRYFRSNVSKLTLDRLPFALKTFASVSLAVLHPLERELSSLIQQRRVPNVRI